MFKILAIGNSFSEDATHFLHNILESAGIDNQVVNLYIGGCPLERHWRNIENDAAEYQYQKDGCRTERYVSIREVLSEERFDAVVTQQASGDSGWENTYEPFLGLMLDFIRKQTQAEVFLHETWAYEANSTHDHFARYGRSQDTMFARLKSAYESEAAKYQLPLIRTGEVIQELRTLPFFQDDARLITRDGFHLDLLYGRYAAALAWAKKICGIDVLANSYMPEVNVDFAPFEKAEPEIIRTIQKKVNETIK